MHLKEKVGGRLPHGMTNDGLTTTPIIGQGVWDRQLNQIQWTSSTVAGKIHWRQTMQCHLLDDNAAGLQASTDHAEPPASAPISQFQWRGQQLHFASLAATAVADYTDLWECCCSSQDDCQWKWIQVSVAWAINDCL